MLYLSDKTNSCSLNDIHVANDEFIYVSELVKLHAQVTSDHTDIKNYTVNVTFSTNRIYICNCYELPIKSFRSSLLQYRSIILLIRHIYVYVKKKKKKEKHK